jgi:hypothetical protein
MRVGIRCLEMSNLVSTRQHGGNASGWYQEDLVPPLHTQIVLVLSQLDSHAGFSYRFETSLAAEGGGFSMGGFFGGGGGSGGGGSGSGPRGLHSAYPVLD